MVFVEPLLLHYEHRDCRRIGGQALEADDLTPGTIIPAAIIVIVAATERDDRDQRYQKRH